MNARPRFSRSSRARLTEYDRDRFAGSTLFDRLGRAVCRAGCLPRKELFEAWELARRVRRLIRGGRVVDVGGGHGLLAHVMLILDDSSPAAVVVDPMLSPSSAKVHEALVHEWPRLGGRITFLHAALEDVEHFSTDVMVSSHACGALTDRILERAMAVRAKVAVLPCCHDLAGSETGNLTGWLDGPAAVDVMRAVRLRDRGYRIATSTIPADVTPKNRLLVGIPAEALRPFDER